MSSPTSTIQSSSRFEPWLLERVCEPILDKIPARVHPNTISIINHAICWSAFIAVAAAPYVDPRQAFLLRIWGGVGLLLSMVLDCLDGMHARRTGQCSKTGEVLDHWFDAINVPLAGAAVLATLQLDPITTAVTISLTAIVYNLQTAAFQHHKKFIHGPTSGTEGQFALGLLLMGFGALLYFFPRDARWVSMFLLGIVWFVNVMQAKMVAFYVPHLKKYRAAVAFAVLTGLIGALHVGGIISGRACVLAVVFVSFRISGSYVLYTVARKPYGGIDWVLFAWVGLILGAHLIAGRVYFSEGVALDTLLAYLGMFYVAGANVVDYTRQIPHLRELTAAGQASTSS